MYSGILLVSGKKHYVFWHLGEIEGGEAKGGKPSSRRRRLKKINIALDPSKIDSNLSYYFLRIKI